MRSWPAVQNQKHSRYDDLHTISLSLRGKSPDYYLPGRRGKGRSYYKSALVIVDEVGYTPITKEECNLFFRFIANRYEKASTIITSNKAFSDWTEMFHDPIIVTAILDRLLHHSVVINIRGKSFRLKEKIEKEGIKMNVPEG